jgi:hypothetical protein
MAKRATQAYGEDPVVAADISEAGPKDTAGSTCSSTPPALREGTPGLPEDTEWDLHTKLTASEDGWFITGTEVRVDGGTHF